MLQGNGIAVVLPPKPPLAECDDFIAAGCGPCIGANDGKTCDACYIDGSFSCIKKGAACAGGMFLSFFLKHFKIFSLFFKKAM